MFGVRLFLGSYLTGIVLTNALSFFILSTINQIIVSKKISIVNNHDIDPNVKVKKYLLGNYKNKELNNIFTLSLILSLTILFFWSIQWFDSGVFQVFVSILNFSSLCLFNYIFYRDTYRSETEDFIYWIKNSKMFFPMIISGLAVMKLLY